MKNGKLTLEGGKLKTDTEVKIPVEGRVMPYCQDEVKKAFNIIKAAMEEDCPSEPGSYAHSWHCNLAMCFEDELMQNKSDDAHIICNAAASRFMKMCFDVETKA